MTVQTFQQALDWLYRFVTFDATRSTDEYKLARMERLLARLGAPHNQFRSVLIAGTKGKGSTAAILANILRLGGYRTGLFTSPHLHTFRERIRVNDVLITREQIVTGVQKLESIVHDVPDVTWFQLVTALALDFFSQQNVEIAVVEVGLGGRLDATNVLQPRVSVVTPISFDHVEVLGHTLSAIAREKAGIIKPNTPVVVAPQPVEAREVIGAIAAEKSAPLVEVGRDWIFQPIAADLSGQSFRVRAMQDPHPQEYRIPLLGHHQLANATVALVVAQELERQGWHFSPEARQQALASVQWPARLEVLSHDPVILADGAHNRASAHELAATLRDLFPQARLHLIFGASSDKDIRGMFEELLPGAASLTLTQSHHPRAASIQNLTSMAEMFRVDQSIAPSVTEALSVERARIEMRPDLQDVICVTGSLFVAAEARAAILAESGIQVEGDD